MNIDFFMVDTVTVQARTGVDNNGMPTYSAQVSVPCRWEYGARLMLSPTGANLNVMAAMTSTVQINPDDNVWPPGADTTDATQAKRPLMIKNGSEPSSGFVIYETYFS